MSTADEIPVEGSVPLWEVPGWRERFGVVAGITGRGSDPGHPFDLGLWSRTPVGECMTRWRDFRKALPGLPYGIFAHQVHGTDVLIHADPSAEWAIFNGVDGHVTDVAGAVLLVTVADCVPVYLIDPRSRSIALLHAGWRGTASGMLERGLGLLCAHASARSSDIVMHCGVAISGARYEVGPEVAVAVDNSLPSDRHSFLDLRAVLKRQGEALGIGEISVSGRCSASEPEHFFSHRGSGGADGRMVAYLGLPL